MNWADLSCADSELGTYARTLLILPLTKSAQSDEEWLQSPPRLPPHGFSIGVFDHSRLSRYRISQLVVKVSLEALTRTSFGSDVAELR